MSLVEFESDLACDLTLKSTMIKCFSCGNDNLEFSRFCDECGTKLDHAVDSLQELPLYVPPAKADVPSNNPSNVTSIGVSPFKYEPPNTEHAIQAAVSADGGSMNAKLVIERGDSPGIEFRLSGSECTIGRWDADNGVFPDVDLDAHDSDAKVSRRHARIKLKEGQYVIEDLGSTNGTYVNRGRRLLPGNTHILNDGDEIIVGKTFMRFYIIG